MFKKMLSILSVLSCTICSNEKNSTVYDWNKILNIPPLNIEEGHQILHFNPRNKPFQSHSAAQNFVETYLKSAKPLKSDADVLRFASNAIEIEGAFIEMGVCTGKTINFIAALNPFQKIYGFDSFEGLPEEWIRADGSFKKGTFGFFDPSLLPSVLHNVVLFKGWFSETLPIFKKEVLKDLPIAFLFIDSDLYSSAIETLHAFSKNIVPGTVIVFDEFYNYPGAEYHEFKALTEFLEETGLNAEYIAYNTYHEQVALKIRKGE